MKRLMMAVFAAMLLVGFSAPAFADEKKPAETKAEKKEMKKDEKKKDEKKK